MSYPVLLGAVVVVTGTNDRIRWREVATTNNATIAAGTYFLRGDGAADDLCLAIKTAIEAAGASANTYSVVAARSLTPTAAHTAVTLTRLTGADSFGIVVDGLAHPLAAKILDQHEPKLQILREDRRCRKALPAQMLAHFGPDFLVGFFIVSNALDIVHQIQCQGVTDCRHAHDSARSKWV